jgi:class 3 adenylate cyclase
VFAGLIIIELFLLTLLVCGIHALRGRLGLIPLFMVVGLLEATLFFASRMPPIYVPTVNGDPSLLYFSAALSMILVIVFLVYALDGTRAARRVIVAFVVLFLFHSVLDEVTAFHALNPPEGIVAVLDHPAALPNRRLERIGSLVAFLADFVTLAVVYQAATNIKLPIPAAFFIALMVATVTDAIVFDSIYGGTVDLGSIPVLQKLEASLAVAVPASFYVAWQRRRLGKGSGERGVFDIVDVRQTMRALEAKLGIIQATFKRYVPPDVVNELMANPKQVDLGGELRDVTIVFCDLRGYTTLTEHAGPTWAIAFLNRYFEHVSAPILAHGGIIIELEGDGVLAAFGAPVARTDHASRALRACLEIRTAMQRLEAACIADGSIELWKEAGVDGVNARIALHSGPVVAGNIGTHQRLKYTVVGDTVNTTARVETLAKRLGRDILLTSATATELGADAAGVTLVDEGVHAVAGRSKTVQVYSVEASVCHSSRPTHARP